MTLAYITLYNVLRCVCVCVSVCLSHVDATSNPISGIRWNFAVFSLRVSHTTFQTSHSLRRLVLIQHQSCTATTLQATITRQNNWAREAVAESRRVYEIIYAYTRSKGVSRMHGACFPNGGMATKGNVAHTLIDGKHFIGWYAGHLQRSVVLLVDYVE